MQTTTNHSKVPNHYLGSHCDPTKKCCRSSRAQSSNSPPLMEGLGDAFAAAAALLGGGAGGGGDREGDEAALPALGDAFDIAGHIVALEAPPREAPAHGFVQRSAAVTAYARSVKHRKALQVETDRLHAQIQGMEERLFFFSEFL